MHQVCNNVPILDLYICVGVDGSVITCFDLDLIDTVLFVMCMNSGMFKIFHEKILIPKPKVGVWRKGPHKYATADNYFMM